jgi:hypothetical protein
VITSGVAWDPVLATHGTRYKFQQGQHRRGRLRPRQSATKQTVQADGRGEPYTALRNTVTLPDIMGSPARHNPNPITR